jgi:chorismate synthase
MEEDLNIKKRPSHAYLQDPRRYNIQMQEGGLKSSK